MLKPGDKAPEFSLISDEGKKVSLNDLKAGKLTDEMTATMEKIGADMSKQYKTA